MKVESFRVVPVLPERLAGLRELAYNVLWSWDEEIRAVFTRIDLTLWNETDQNPVLMLGRVSQQRLEELARDEGFLGFYDRTLEHLRAYLAETTWWDRRYPERPRIAYFSAEFGLTECLPIYSGGLGVLAGHHLKSASDLGVPVVGVGLLYQQGYFRQYLTPDGWQQEKYPVNDFYNLPVLPVADARGEPLRVSLRLAGRDLLVAVWRAEVGRIPLILLDTNLSENPQDLQDVTDQLYGGDHETRIRQEIVLGIGGMRALEAMGLEPVVCHLNEGHAAFLSLERIRQLMRKHGATFPQALEAARAGGVFTTHTPVPAGFDVFTAELMERYFAEYAGEVGITWKRFLELGGGTPGLAAETFNMAGLALRTSSHVNGVSELHGEISRGLLQKYLPEVPEEEMPVSHVTNGAHTRSCVSREMASLFDRYLGADWWRRPGLAATWQGVESIPDEELWATHERRRERLVAFTRKRLMRQVEQRGGSARDVEKARGVLSTRSLTIGFARRFATYKRASLILHDLARLKRILLEHEREVQLIFAGKAHPKDEAGKEMLKAVVEFCQQPDVRAHAVFLEDYDLVVARYLVQGVDVWLNTPRRGLEASGTSGMKVLPNGGLNLSTLDGWWAEAYEPELGWAIGRGETYDDLAYQDTVESNALYDTLEKEIVPIFYGRGADGLPRSWISRMKKSMRVLSPRFSSNRMVWEYGERFYLPAARAFDTVSGNGLETARKLAEWKRRVFAAWSEVAVLQVAAATPTTRPVGDGLGIEARVQLGPLQPADVVVEAYHGPLDERRRIKGGQAVPLRLVESEGGGVHRYGGTLPCSRSGLNGYGVRARPCHDDDGGLLATGLMKWW